MTENEITFTAKSTVKSEDLDHRRKILFNIGKYNLAVVAGKQQFDQLDLARQRAKNVKWRALETLDKQLEDFEANFQKREAK